MFRIVSERKGDAVIGFRVQKQGWRRHTENTTGGEVWRNKGARVFSMDDARHNLAFYVAESQAATVPVTYDVMPLQTGDTFRY